MESTLRERVIQVLDLKGVRLSQFAKEIDMNPSTISRQLNGDRGISIELVQGIIHVYDDISPDWLLMGQGQMLRAKGISPRERTFRDEAKEEIRSALNEEIKPTFIKMLSESEERLRDTHEMVRILAETSKDNMDMYDSHLKSLENARDKAQENLAKEIDHSSRLTTELHETHNEIRAIGDDLRAMRESFFRMENALQRAVEILTKKG